MTRVVSHAVDPAALPSVANEGASAAAAAQGRFDAIDTARGLSVLAMLAAHLAGTDGGTTTFERGLTTFLAAIEPTVAALFCVVAGISWTIQAERVAVTPRFRRYFAMRALALGAFGVLFHALFWTSEILVPFAMMMALSLVVLGRGPVASGSAAFLVVAVSPIVTRRLGDLAVTDWLENGLHAADRSFGWVTLRYLFVDGSYPLVSWMAFPLLGILFWQTGRGRLGVRAWCLGALLVTLLGWVLAAHVAPNVRGVPGTERYLAGGWTPSSPTFVIANGAGALAIIAALLWGWGTAPMPRGLQPLVLFGRASLSHYVLHIVVAYSALRLWYPAEDWPVVTGFRVFLVYLAAGIPLTVVWFAHHTHGPLEMLWARASRRPSPRAAEGGDPPSLVESRGEPGSAGVFATGAFSSGDVLLHLDGLLATRASPCSIQIGAGMHLEAAPGSPTPWLRLNHGCDPNAYVDCGRRALVAARSIAAGDEVRFDYNTTEWELAAPFVCSCGAPGCVGVVRGFRHLTPLWQQALLASAAPHIQSLHAQSADPCTESGRGRSPSYGVGQSGGGSHGG